jgi:hypothetical protein
MKFIRALFAHQEIIKRKNQARYADAIQIIRGSLTSPNVHSVLTDEEFSALVNAASELEAAAIAAFADISDVQLYLQNLWEPELKIQREKEEAERSTSESWDTEIPMAALALDMPE